MILFLIGRILKINVKIDNDVYSLVNVYAPNDINDFLFFFKELTNFIDSKNTIMAGDFNEIFDPSLDIGINNTTFNLRSSNSLEAVLNNYYLVDIWRHRNPGKTEFSWFQFVENILKQSRIDFFLISRTFLQYVMNSYISYTTLSDHNFVCLKLDFSRVDRGPGIWIFLKQ